jgi:hypothetical protein
MLDIPVFHDDQHGTAIISGAACSTPSSWWASAWMNAHHHLRRRRLCHLLRRVDDPPGRQSRENIMLVDTRGVVYKGRTEGMNEYKERLRRGDRCPHPGRCRARRRCVLRPFGRRYPHPRDGQDHGRAPAHLRHGQPRPEIKYELAREARPMPSSPPAARIIPTRSTTCWASRSSSAARWMCAPRHQRRDEARRHRALAALTAKTCPTACCALTAWTA